MDEKMNTRRSLRRGVTTGSCAAAAAKAAGLLLLTGACPKQVDIPLPDGTRMQLPVAGFSLDNGQATAWVIKDAGDDPDVTHNAAIHCRVSAVGKPGVEVLGGKGVGRVTRPGLAVGVGEAAVNPVPRAQIVQAASEALDAGEEKKIGLRVVVEVPQGRELADKTLNPRLGIVGGISILGTQGRVKPFSHQAYCATIDRALDVARAAGHAHVVFSTGRRSEKSARALVPSLAEECFIQAGDFFARAMRSAAEREFERVTWVLFWGKVVKQAQGLASTHAKDGSQDFSALAEWARQEGLDADLCRETAQANTARHVWDLIQDHEAAPALARTVCVRAARQAVRFAGRGLQVRYLLLDAQGRLLLETAEEWEQ